MGKLITRCVLSGLGALGLAMTLAISGCGGNENERENARTAAPDLPPENPNESFADRRARTRGASKQGEKIEARNKAAAEKKAAGGE
jgi:hypothetical protein